MRCPLKSRSDWEILRKLVLSEASQASHFILGQRARQAELRYTLEMSRMCRKTIHRAWMICCGVSMQRRKNDQSVLTDGRSFFQSLMAAFARRYRDILDRFQNTEDRNAGKFMRTLTVEERKRQCLSCHVHAHAVSIVIRIILHGARACVDLGSSQEMLLRSLPH